MSVSDKLLSLVHSEPLCDIKKFISDHFTDLSWKTITHKKSGDNLLHCAVRFGQLETLKFLIEKGLDFELGNFDGKRPLHEAAQMGSIDCVEHLLEKGAQIDALKRADWTPLMLACTKSNLQMVHTLVSHGASLSVRNKDGWTAFHVACRESDSSIADYLLDCESSLWDTVSNNGRTPLHTAAMHGQQGVVEILLKRGSYSVDCKDSCGSTPFMDAIRSGHPSIATQLIHQQHVNPCETDSLGRQAIYLAAQAGCLSSIHYLIDAVLCDINTRTSTSLVTPLHLAAKECHADTVELLLSRGADVHATDHKGRTALHLACGSQSEQCVRALIASGAKDTEDHFGNCASSLARKQSIKDLLKLT